jgi:3',5'-cyclic AMP phosphodiesterase CpdA
LHLAEIPNRHSILDKRGLLTNAVKQAIVADLKKTILTCKMANLGSALENILDGDSVALLKQVKAERLIEVIDETLQKIARSDKSLHQLTLEALKSLTIATSYNPGALDCLCNFIDDERLDAIVITGDLATTGLGPDLEKARLFLESKSEFDQSIAYVAAPVHLLPGNHDRFIYTGRGFLFAPGGKDFDSVFASRWSTPVTVYDVLRNQDLSILLVAADFGLISEKDSTFPLLKLNRLAQGRIYPEILNQLETTTQQAQREERTRGVRTLVTLWAIHFPPFFPHRNAGSVGRILDRLTKGLIDEQKLIDSARLHNVSAILAGHTHEADDYSAGDHRLRILCAGTATQDDVVEKHCQIIEVSKNAIGQPKIIIKEYLQDRNASSFVAR